MLDVCLHKKEKGVCLDKFLFFIYKRIGLQFSFYACLLWVLNIFNEFLV